MKCFNVGVLATCVLCVASVLGCGSGASNGCDFDSTFEAIQSQVFDAKGCTSAACHGTGDDPAGGLDLREGFALESLIHVDGASGDMPLVMPGDHDTSLLYLKLAAKTFGTDLPAGIAGDPMPFGEQLPALTEGELEALKIWIRGGATGDTVMKGTEDLLGCSEPVEPDPNKIQPLVAPDRSEGLQFYSGGWDLAADEAGSSSTDAILAA